MHGTQKVRARVADSATAIFSIDAHAGRLAGSITPDYAHDFASGQNARQTPPWENQLWGSVGGVQPDSAG